MLRVEVTGIMMWPDQRPAATLQEVVEIIWSRKCIFAIILGLWLFQLSM
jgi:hypothetical protein